MFCLTSPVVKLWLKIRFFFKNFQWKSPILKFYKSLRNFIGCMEKPIYCHMQIRLYYGSVWLAIRLSVWCWVEVSHVEFRNPWNSFWQGFFTYHNSLCGPLNVSVTRPFPRVHQIRANVMEPAVWYHGICLNSWYQSVWFCWAVSSLFGRTEMSTAAAGLNMLWKLWDLYYHQIFFLVRNWCWIWACHVVYRSFFGIRNRNFHEWERQTCDWTWRWKWLWGLALLSVYTNRVYVVLKC